MVVRLGLLASSLLLALCVSSPVFAYCRTHTDDPGASSCPEACQELGDPLFWRRRNLEYSYNAKGFPGLSDAQLRSIIGASFRTWQEVSCDGEALGITFTPTAGTTPLQEGPKRTEPNGNVIAHLTESEWRTRGYDSLAYAITAVWFDETRGGEIVGADILFNGRMDPFGICSERGCTSSDPRTDLRNVATHEIGHFLGLSHSDVPDSTMWCGAQPDEVSKRSLTADDIKGVCEAFKRDPAAAEGGGGSCSLAAGTKPPLLELALACLVGLATRRRRTPR